MEFQNDEMETFLQFHDVSARRRADQSRAHVALLGVELADVARVLVVVDDLLVVISPEDKHGNGGRVGQVGRVDLLTRVDMFNSSNPSLQCKSLNNKGRMGRSEKFL